MGARPNYMKVAPIMAAVDAEVARGGPVAFEQLLVHTGQHYDRALSELFFEELGLPRPDVNLGVGSGSHARQTARIMEAFEPVLESYQPDLVIVVGDVNSTLACALDARKLGIPVAHVEAGLRSGDMSMPEEINRRATDAIVDLLFTTDRIADACLRREGIDPAAIHRVGNVMIDSLLHHREKALSRPTLGLHELLDGAGQPIPYAVVTLHRPGNVDVAETLHAIGSALAKLGESMPVIFPVHPRARARISEFGLDGLFSRENGIRLIEPAGYLDFMNLVAHARLVLTDSGGIQEETTILGVPCLTLRDNTERPITLEQGTNRLVGNRTEAIVAGIEAVLSDRAPDPCFPELWDGHAGERIVRAIVAWWSQATRAEGVPQAERRASVGVESGA
nr:UDP-N-acetylglucosamine 2-epimerase (non-hydrolyzing) [Halofilum ochraceum]